MNHGHMPLPLFELWVPATETGALPVDRLVQWADEQIARLDKPPFWLLELATANDVEGIRVAMRSVSLPDCPRKPGDHDVIYLGCLYLCFQAGRITLFDLLQRAGSYSDCRSGNWIPDCETFYALLNELDGGGPTIPSDRPLKERVAALFSPMVGTLRELFGVDESTPVEAMLPEMI